MHRACKCAGSELATSAQTFGCSDLGVDSRIALPSQAIQQNLQVLHSNLQACHSILQTPRRLCTRGVPIRLAVGCSCCLLAAIVPADFLRPFETASRGMCRTPGRYATLSKSMRVVFTNTIQPKTTRYLQIVLMFHPAVVGCAGTNRLLLFVPDNARYCIHHR